MNLNYLIQEVLSIIDSLYACGKISGAPATGIHDLDLFIPGFIKETLTVFAPEGKANETVLFYSIFTNITKSGTKVLFISLSSSEIKAMKTCISVQCHIRLSKLHNGLLTLSEFDRLKQVCSEMCEKDVIHIVAPAEADSMCIEEIIENAVINSGIEMVFLENAHLICVPGKLSSDQSRMSFILGRLKRMAKKTKLPIAITAPGSIFSQSSPMDQGSPIRQVDTFVRLTIPEKDTEEIETDNDWRWQQEGLVEKNRDGLVGSFDFIVDYREMRICEPADEESKSLY